MTIQKNKRAYQIIPCVQGDTPVLNIFLHGFFSLHRSDSHILRAADIAALDSLKQSSSWLIQWDSGNSTEVLTKASANPLVRFGLVSRSLPFAAGALSYAAYRYYQENEQKANHLGEALWTAVAEKLVRENQKFTEINLIGHSLGARIIIISLLKQWIQAHYLPIHHVILLGGVAGLQQDWNHLMNTFSGGLFNVYSKRDMALVLRPTMGKLIGRHPIPLEHPRLINHYTNLAHSDYWKYMDRILMDLDAQWVKRRDSE